MLSEFTHHGLRSRRGQGRGDICHQVLDPVVVAGPWLLAGGVAYLLGTPGGATPSLGAFRTVYALM